MKTIRKLSAFLLLASVMSAFGGPATLEPQPSLIPADENSHDLFYYETTYTFDSDFKESKLGHGDSLYNDFSYDHRFLITGKWYFRAGVEYERYDFGGSDPGVYFQDNVTWDAFDIPGKAYVTFPLKKDKIFAVVAVGGGIYQDPPVAPGGGIIWIFNDKLRLQGVFPRPALIYQPNDDWEFRITGELNYTSFRTDDVLTTERKLQLHNAVVQYSEDRAGVQIAYSGLKPLKLIVGGGVTVERNFDFFRANQSKRTDPAPYIRVAAEAKF